MLIAIGLDAAGIKHPLELLERATDNAAVLCRVIIIDGSKALFKVIRRKLARRTPIQHCQIHNARNIVECLREHSRASVVHAVLR